MKAYAASRRDEHAGIAARAVSALVALGNASIEYDTLRRSFEAEGADLAYARPIDPSAIDAVGNPLDRDSLLRQTLTSAIEAGFATIADLPADWLAVRTLPVASQPAPRPARRGQVSRFTIKAKRTPVSEGAASLATDGSPWTR
jgi:hypothetical protein